MGTGENCSIDALSMFAADVIRKAGTESLKFYGCGKRDLKFDEELITAAEIHLADFFRDQIAREYPSHQVFSADQLEDGYSHEGKRYLWVFDPLDGVDNFQTGIPIWAMSMALFENHWPIFGMVYMPSTGDMFQARAESQAMHGDKAMQISPQDAVDDESLLLIFSRFHQRFHSKFPGKIRNLGCTAAHICYVAMGRADAAVIANESFQDLAAARVIIESAGGKFFKMDGSECFLHDYLDGQKIDEPLLVTAPEKFSSVLACLDKIE